MNEIYFSPHSFVDAPARRFAEAVARGQVHEAMRLAKGLANGVDTTAPDGVTALLIAVNHIDLPMISALLQAGANPNGGQGRAPIALAVSAPDLAMARMLLSAGADPNGRMDSKPALSVTALRGDQRAAALLLQFHADPNLGDGLDSTPAMEAAAAQHWHFVLFMLDHGASPWVSTTAGVTLATYASLSRINAASNEGKAWLQVIDRLKAAAVPWPPPLPKEVVKLRASGRWPPPGVMRH
ncbi:MAG: ankyrin repeat domain-containing protein [Steroidobacteraceae bacterium]